MGFSKSRLFYTSSVTINSSGEEQGECRTRVSSVDVLNASVNVYILSTPNILAVSELISKASIEQKFIRHGVGRIACFSLFESSCIQRSNVETQTLRRAAASFRVINPS